MTAEKIKELIKEAIDGIVTSVNGKADKDLENVDTSKSILVDSFRDGASWYRIYSDGFCVQGGHFYDVSANGAWRTITLLKPYVDNNYIVQMTPASDQDIYSSTLGSYYYGCSYKMSNCFQVLCHTYKNITSRDWIAFGYIR